MDSVRVSFYFILLSFYFPIWGRKFRIILNKTNSLFPISSKFKNRSTFVFGIFSREKVFRLIHLVEDSISRFLPIVPILQPCSYYFSNLRIGLLFRFPWPKSPPSSSRFHFRSRWDWWCRIINKKRKLITGALDLIFLRKNITATQISFHIRFSLENLFDHRSFSLTKQNSRSI